MDVESGAGHRGRDEQACDMLENVSDVALEQFTGAFVAVLTELAAWHERRGLRAPSGRRLALEPCVGDDGQP